MIAHAMLHLINDALRGYDPTLTREETSIAFLRDVARVLADVAYYVRALRALIP